MEGLLLILLAFILIIAEAHLPSFGILGIVGIITLLAGGNLIIEQGGIFGIQLDWGFFIGLAVASALPMLIGSYVIAKHRNKKPISGVEGMIGHDARVVEWSGKNGRVHIQGELWAAHSENSHALNEGDTVIVSDINDMSLRIRLKL